MTNHAGALPLVSCIMPTYGRAKLVAESIQMFLAQDYPHKELLVLNDCPGQKLLIDAANVHVFNEDARYPSLGWKRNAAIERAAGSLIAVWDDDDVYLPWRLSYSVARMQELQVPFFLAREYWAYWGEQQLHHNQSAPGWIGHPLVMFTKDLWAQAGGYPNITLGEDAEFFDKAFRCMGTGFINHPLSIIDRFFILRGQSLYHHTSINGGKQPADTMPGEITIQPQTIADEVLRRAAQRLIVRREAASREVGQFICDETGLLRSAVRERMLIDCLQRVDITVPESLDPIDLCIATAASADYLDWADDLFGSIRANGQCSGAQLVLFSLDANRNAEIIAEKHKAIVVPCTPIAELNPSANSVLYSIARVIPASRYICFDADILVFDDLRPILNEIDRHPDGAVLACREAFWAENLNQAIETIYGGTRDDIALLLNNCDRKEGEYSFVVNDGIFAGSHAGLRALDAAIRSMCSAPEWLDANLIIGWRNQFVFNLALAKLNCGVELHPRFNVQLNCPGHLADKLSASNCTGPNPEIAVVHFNGSGRNKHSNLRGRYSRFHPPK